MRGRPGEMGNARAAGPFKKVAYAFGRRRQYHRAAPHQGPEQYLESPVSAHIVKSTPHSVASYQHVIQRTDKAGQGVHDKLWLCRRARSEQNPLGFMRSNMFIRSCRVRVEVTADTCDAWSHMLRSVVGNNNIDLGQSQDGRQMGGCYVG